MIGTIEITRLVFGTEQREVSIKVHLKRRLYATEFFLAIKSHYTSKITAYNYKYYYKPGKYGKQHLNFPAIKSNV